MRRLPDEPDIEALIWGDYDLGPSNLSTDSRTALFPSSGYLQTNTQPRYRIRDDARLHYLARLAERHEFDVASAFEWVNYTAHNIPYAMLKISGSCLTEELAQDVADLSHVISLAVIVGGGEEITEECEKRGLPIVRQGPWRATPPEVLDVVVNVMSSLANRFSAMINKYGGASHPLVGTPAKPLLFAEKVDWFENFLIDGKRVDAGYFGRIPESMERDYLTATLVDQLEGITGSLDMTPVIAALGHQRAGQMPKNGYQPLNIDGDEAMRLLAHRIGPEEFLFITPSGGVKMPHPNSSPYIAPNLSLEEFEEERNRFDGSTRLKLDAAFRILQEYGGTRTVALVAPDKAVPYLLDRSIEPLRVSSSTATGSLLFNAPPHRYGPHGTTLTLTL